MPANLHEGQYTKPRENSETRRGRWPGELKLPFLPRDPMAPSIRFLLNRAPSPQQNIQMSESTTESTPTQRDRRVSSWWRALAIFLLLVLMLAWAAATSMTTQLKAQIENLQHRLIELPQIRHVSVLLDKDGLPAMLATYNPKDRSLQIQRLNEVKEGREDSMQVWAIRGSDESTARSLGVIESKYKTLQMPVMESDLDGVTALGISAENKGGVTPGQGPSLPWLFKGWLVQKSI